MLPLNYPWAGETFFCSKFIEVLNRDGTKSEAIKHACNKVQFAEDFGIIRYYEPIQALIVEAHVPLFKA